MKLRDQKCVVVSLVYAADEFEIDTKAMHVRHRPGLHIECNYADVVGVYAYAIGKDEQVVAMVHASRADLDAVRDRKPTVWAKYPYDCAKHFVLKMLEDELGNRVAS